MAFIIGDGKGRGYESSVSSANRLNISSKSNPRIFYISRDEEKAYTVQSVDSNADAGDYILYLKNTSSTDLLYIERFEYHSANASLWKLWEVTGTAAGSSALTPSNLNLTSGLTAAATVRGDGAISGLTTVKILGTHRNAANSEGQMYYGDALILGPNDAVAVEYDTGTTGAAEVDVFFHYESISREN